MTTTTAALTNRNMWNTSEKLCPQTHKRKQPFHSFWSRCQRHHIVSCAPATSRENSIIETVNVCYIYKLIIISLFDFRLSLSDGFGWCWLIRVANKRLCVWWRRRRRAHWIHYVNDTWTTSTCTNVILSVDFELNSHCTIITSRDKPQVLLLADWMECQPAGRPTGLNSWKTLEFCLRTTFVQSTTKLQHSETHEENSFIFKTFSQINESFIMEKNVDRLNGTPEVITSSAHFRYRIFQWQSSITIPNEYSI